MKKNRIIGLIRAIGILLNLAVDNHFLAVMISGDNVIWLRVGICRLSESIYWYEICLKQKKIVILS